MGSALLDAVMAREEARARDLLASNPNAVRWKTQNAGMTAVHVAAALGDAALLALLRDKARALSFFGAALACLV